VRYQAALHSANASRYITAARKARKRAGKGRRS
jgi:hypothetical protein